MGVARQHRHLHRTLKEVWSLKCGGVLWLIRLALLFLSGLVLTTSRTVQEDSALGYSLVAAGVTVSAIGVLLLLRPARITALCTSSSPGAESVVAATLEHI